MRVNLVYRAAISFFLVCFFVPHAFAQGPFGGIGAIKEKIQEELFMKAANSLLNNELPIKLDATTALPTVETLPGGPFAPHPIAFTPAMMNKPLPPGDYTINVTAFCTQYSVHRPGRGVAYKLAPLQGRLAGVIATLLWRGLQAGVTPRHLMAVSWGMQAGLSYAQMPASFQATIDQLIPDKKGLLAGDFLDNLEDLYNKSSHGTKLPPFDTLMSRMGAFGDLVLSSRRQRDALMAKGESDEVREQTLFAGQESGVYAPVMAENGPWTVRIPGVAYMRYKIEGGNLANDNFVEIRIAGKNGSLAAAGQPHLQDVSYTPGGQASDFLGSTTLASLLGATPNIFSGQVDADGLIGYAQGQGAQALIPVASPAPQSPCTIEAVAIATKPAKRDGIRFGVGEKVTLVAHDGVGPVAATWRIASGLGEVAKDTGLFNAPSAGGTTEVVATVSENVSCSKPLTIVEPSGLLFYTLLSRGYTYNASRYERTFYFSPAVFMTPGDVSFANIGIKEWEPNPADDIKNGAKPYNSVSNHLVQTSAGPAWFLACDYVGADSMRVASIKNILENTSQWDYKKLSATTDTTDTLYPSRPFSLVKTDVSDPMIAPFSISLSKGQIANYSDGTEVPAPGQTANLTIEDSSRPSVMKKATSNEQCFQDFVKEFNFAELQ